MIPMETLKTLNNHQQYINVLQLSERIQCAIQRLKQHRIEQEIDHLLLQTSPTETMMTYYDNNSNNSMMMMNAKYKSLPKLITTKKHLSSSSSSSTVTTIAQYDHKKEKTNSNTTTVYQSKSGGSSRHGGFDSAVDLYITARQIEEEKEEEEALLQKQKPPLPPPPLTRSTYLRTKPLPSIHYNKSKLLPITHTKKKYYGIKDLLRRTYHLDNIVVTRSKLSYYFVKLYASYDKATGEQKAVLKLSLTTSKDHNLFIIPYFNFTFYHHLQHAMTKQQKMLDASMLTDISDTQIQSALSIWLHYYHHQLPSLHHVSHILRQGLGIYIVYCVS